MRQGRLPWMMVAVVVVALVGCHTIEEELGESPSEPSPVASVAPITIPIILPASDPTPVPAPSPTPTAGPVPGTPTPTPTPEPEPPPPPPTGSGCGLPPQSPSHSCNRTSATFLHDVNDAIDAVVENNPGLFNLNDKVCTTCYRIKDHDRYVQKVVSQMERRGYCALYDGEELAVKNIQSFNDQYDISTSSGYIRRGDGSYRSTCWPAWF